MNGDSADRLEPIDTRRADPAMVLVEALARVVTAQGEVLNSMSKDLEQTIRNVAKLALQTQNIIQILSGEKGGTIH